MDSRAPPSPTALIVEGNHPTLDTLHEVLEDAGFETTAVDTGTPAMTMLAERRFDVLLVDVTLPDMNGLSLCEEARQRYQERIVILVLSDQEIEHADWTPLADVYGYRPGWGMPSAADQAEIVRLMTATERQGGSARPSATAQG